jgi:hypothetical protein
MGKGGGGLKTCGILVNKYDGKKIEPKMWVECGKYNPSIERHPTLPHYTTAHLIPP